MQDFENGVDLVGDEVESSTGTDETLGLEDDAVSDGEPVSDGESVVDGSEDVSESSEREELNDVVVDGSGDIVSDSSTGYVAFCSVELEQAIYQIRDNTNLLCYGIFPLFASCLIAYLFFGWALKFFNGRG